MKHLCSLQRMSSLFWIFDNSLPDNLGLLFPFSTVLHKHYFLQYAFAMISPLNLEFNYLEERKGVAYFSQIFMYLGVQGSQEMLRKSRSPHYNFLPTGALLRFKGPRRKYCLTLKKKKRSHYPQDQSSNAST